MNDMIVSFQGLSIGDRVQVYLSTGDKTYGHRLGTIRGFEFEQRFRIHVDLDEAANGRTKVLSEKRYVRKLSLLELIALAAR